MTPTALFLTHDRLPRCYYWNLSIYLILSPKLIFGTIKESLSSANKQEVAARFTSAFVTNSLAVSIS
jgi:hypothetical protein